MSHSMRLSAHIEHLGVEPVKEIGPTFVLAANLPRRKDAEIEA